MDGLDLDDGRLARLFAIDADSWALEADLTEEFFAMFGDRVPPALHDRLARLRAALAR